jgi:hypothetical protein
MKNEMNSILPAIMAVINTIFVKGDNSAISATVALCNPKNGPLLLMVVMIALKAFPKSKSENVRANDAMVAKMM